MAAQKYHEMCIILNRHSIRMAASSRALKLFSPSVELICSRCMPFSTTSAAQSGHSRWSKIKHDKGAVDAKKNVQRSVYAREIALCSKCRNIFSSLKNQFLKFLVYGGDINNNHRLAALCANAKKGTSYTS